MSTIKVKILTGQEWDLEKWNGDVWEDPDEVGDAGTLNSDESSLSMGVASSILVETAPPAPAEASPSPFERINPVLPNEAIRASPEIANRQDNADSLQNSLLQLLFGFLFLF